MNMGGLPRRGLHRLAQPVTTELQAGAPGVLGRGFPGPHPGAGSWTQHQQDLRGIKAEICPAHGLPPTVPQRGGLCPGRCVSVRF